MAREWDESAFELFDLDDVEPLSWDDESDASAAVYDAAPELTPAEDERLRELFLAGLGVEPVSRAQRADLLEAVLQAAGAPVQEEPQPSARPRHLRVVEGGLSVAAAAPEAQPVAAAEASPDMDAEVSEALQRHRTAHTQLRITRVAAALAIVLLVAGGGLAYTLPTAFVRVVGGNSTVRLGVNLFGVTVSATAEDAASQAILDEAQVNNLGYGDALRALATSLSGAGANGLNVEVDSSVTSLQRTALEDDAAKVMNEQSTLVLPATTSVAQATPQLPVSPLSPVRPQELVDPAPVLATQLPAAATAAAPEQDTPASSGSAEADYQGGSSSSTGSGSSAGAESSASEQAPSYEWIEPAEQIDSAVAETPESIGESTEPEAAGEEQPSELVDSIGKETAPAPGESAIQDSLGF